MIYFEQDDVLESNQDHNYLWLVDYQEDFVKFVSHLFVLHDLKVNIDKLKLPIGLKLHQGICREKI
jgi:hypothetical protein